jgi:D-inositol-3-phosphate glycosyltransferase
MGEAKSLAHTGTGMRSRLERLAMQTLGARLERHTFHRARRLIAISDAIKQELVTEYGVDPARIAVIGNAVDCKAFQPRAGERSNRVGLSLLCVGRLVPRKNLRLLLEALALCDPAVSCALAGEGPMADELRGLASSLGLAGRVAFLGFQAGEALERCYQRADALVMPSVYEGMPMAILEAKASGLPTVAVAFEGARSLVPEATGIVLDAATPAALAVAFERLLHDRALLIRLSAGARADALQRFDWDVVLTQLIAALDLY